MCTAITYKTRDHYFGRNLDLEYSYHETVTITPRNYPFHFRMAGDMKTHYAMIGMAYVVSEYPLYYEATNEMGLSMAGLNFPDNAFYGPAAEGRDNISPFEFIPWILGQCATLNQVRQRLEQLNLVSVNFSETLPLSPLHWMISDKDASITVESVKEGLKVYENPMGVLTNNPPFDLQTFYLNNYMGLTASAPQNHFCDSLDLKAYSLGMGAIGLPGDASSSSRFVKAVFTKMNSVSGDSESESVSQFFHILSSVAMPRGSVRPEKDKYEITVYSSCCNCDKGIYYYTTYENSQISAVDMHRENLQGSRLINYPVLQGQRIWRQN